MRGIFDYFKSVDRLILHGIDPEADSAAVAKTEELKRGIEALKDLEFRPSMMTFTSFAGGHLQTLMSEFKEVVASAYYGDLPYDKQEVFTFKDGG